MRSPFLSLRYILFFLFGLSCIVLADPAGFISMRWRHHKFQFRMQSWTLSLPGTLYKPAKKFGAIEQRSASHKTPLTATVAYFSANQACDPAWIQASLRPADRNQAEMSHETCRFFKDLKEITVAGEARYK